MLNLTKLDEAIQSIFKDKTDKAGEPYFGHIRRVVEMVKTRTKCPHTVIAAYCHDILEDTGVDIKELPTKTIPYTAEDMFSAGIATAMVMVLTKSKSETYDEYISRIIMGKTYESARIFPGNTTDSMIVQELILIKKCDLLDNANPERLAKIPDQEVADALKTKYYNAMYRMLGT